MFSGWIYNCHCKSVAGFEAQNGWNSGSLLHPSLRQLWFTAPPACRDSGSCSGLSISIFWPYFLSSDPLPLPWDGLSPCFSSQRLPAVFIYLGPPKLSWQMNSWRLQRRGAQIAADLLPGWPGARRTDKIIGAVTSSCFSRLSAWGERNRL